jgi:flagellar biosynthesis protein FlhG
MKEIQDKLWAIGGGKGGVGKSVVSIMIGSTLARQGKKVILVDADLGGSNLHTLAGIKYPAYTLADFIQRKVENLEEVLMDTAVENMKLICGADDILGIANPKSAQKTRIFNHLRTLEADFILLDLGAGTSFTSMDFFLYAPNKIVVLTPQITSIQNAYGFIKASMYRALNQHFRKDPQARELIKMASAAVDDENIDSIDKLKEAFMNLEDNQAEELNKFIKDLRIKIIVNMVRNVRERNVGQIVSTVARNYLCLELENLGIVEYDKILNQSINNMAPFLQEQRDSIAATSFYDIVCTLLEEDEKTETEKLSLQMTAPGTSSF